MTSTAFTASYWLPARDPEECVPGRLLLAAHRLEAGLPAAQVRVVLDEEPEHHVDARVLPRDRVSLRQPLRLRRHADAEVPVGRIRLVAVLGDPQVLRPVELGQLGNEDVDVAELDPALRLAGWHERRRLLRRRVIRLVRVLVEALHARGVSGNEERE